MDEDIEIYTEKPKDKDWYISVRILQLVLCLILTLALVISFRTGGTLRDGYNYLTDGTCSFNELTDAVDALKNFVFSSDNA